MTAEAQDKVRREDSNFEASQEEVGPDEKGARWTENSVSVDAHGTLGEGLMRSGLESKAMLTPEEIGKLETIPKKAAGDLAAKFAGHHRAHMVGPGFGTELLEGLMLAPASVNLDTQNKGVEKFIRMLGSERRPYVQIAVRGTRYTFRLKAGGTDSTTALESARYDIQFKRRDRGATDERGPWPAGDPHVLRFSFAFDVTKSGANITVNTIPSSIPLPGIS